MALSGWQIVVAVAGLALARGAVSLLCLLDEPEDPTVRTRKVLIRPGDALERDGWQWAVVFTRGNEVHGTRSAGRGGVSRQIGFAVPADTWLSWVGEAAGADLPPTHDLGGEGG